MSINIITAFGTMGSKAAANFTRLNDLDEEIKRNTIIITTELRPLEESDKPMAGWKHFPINVGISGDRAESINRNPSRNLALKRYYPEGVIVTGTSDGGAGDPNQGLISFRINRQYAERQIDQAMNALADMPGAAGLGESDAEVVHWTNIIGIGGSTAPQCLEIMSYVHKKLGWVKNVRNRLFTMTPHLLDSNNDRPLKLINGLNRVLELDQAYKDGHIWLPEFTYIYDGAASDGCRVSNPAQSIPMAIARYLTQLTVQPIGEQARGQHINILAHMKEASDKTMQFRYSRGIAGEIRFPANEIIQSENALTAAKAIEFICKDGNDSLDTDPIGGITLIQMDESARTSWKFGSSISRARTHFNVAGLSNMTCADTIARHNNKIASAENELRIDLPTAKAMAEASAMQSAELTIGELKNRIISGSIGFSRAESRIDEAVKKLGIENAATLSASTIENGKMTTASERMKATKVIVNNSVDQILIAEEEEEEQSGVLHLLARIFDSIKTIVVNIFSRGRGNDSRADGQPTRNRDDDLRKTKVELFDKSGEYYVSRIMIDYYEAKSHYLTTLIAQLNVFKIECRRQRERLTRVKEQLEQTASIPPFTSQDDQSSLVLYKDGYIDRIFFENDGTEKARVIASTIRTQGIINFSGARQGDIQIRNLVMKAVNEADYFAFLRSLTVWGEAIRFFGDNEEEARRMLSLFIRRIKPMAIIDEDYDTISQLPNREAVPNVYVSLVQDDQSPIRDLVNQYLMPEIGSINYTAGEPYEIKVISERHRYPLVGFRSIREGLDKKQESHEGDEVITSIADEWEEMLDHFRNDGYNHSGLEDEKAEVASEAQGSEQVLEESPEEPEDSSENIEAEIAGESK